MNLPFYSTVCQEEVTTGTRVLIHPVTGESYGGTDWLNDSKLAEIGAVPLTDDDGDIPENPVQTGTTIVVTEDCLSAKKIKQWRSKTQTELDNEFSAAWGALRDRVNTVRDTLLANLTVELNGVFYDADADGRANLTGVLLAIASGISVGDSVVWRDSNNVNQELTVDELKMLGGLMVAAVQQVYMKSWYIKDAVLPALTTLEQVNALSLEDAFADVGGSSSES
jgi:hypothetical protein